MEWVCSCAGSLCPYVRTFSTSSICLRHIMPPPFFSPLFIPAWSGSVPIYLLFQGTNDLRHLLYQCIETVKQQEGKKYSWRKTENNKGMLKEGGRDRLSTSGEKVQSHVVGMLRGERRGVGIAGVTAPFFTAIIRASCQWEGAEYEGGEGGGVMGWRSGSTEGETWKEEREVCERKV